MKLLELSVWDVMFMSEAEIAFYHFGQFVLVAGCIVGAIALIYYAIKHASVLLMCVFAACLMLLFVFASGVISGTAALAVLLIAILSGVLVKLFNGDKN